ncbi:MAG: hypothetical protein MUO72_14195 [Bacteroidales bacterium]|nr:hypothetical protein [Bacteroidales bacterium]
MRKAVKIKAYTVLLSWMLIFTHNIIPHNHANENLTGCHELVHNSHTTGNDFTGPLKFKSQPEEVTVCHITTFLFHQFNQDTIICRTDSDSNIPPISLSGYASGKTFRIAISDYFNRIPFLRAPPAA